MRYRRGREGWYAGTTKIRFAVAMIWLWVGTGLCGVVDGSRAFAGRIAIEATGRIEAEED